MKRFLLAQLSDLHVVPPGQTAWEGLDTAAATRGAVATLEGLDPRPDLILVSGDLTNDGASESYAHLRSLLEPVSERIVVLPGNCDVVENLRAGLPADWFPAGEGSDFVVEGVPRLVCLDSSRHPMHGGTLDAAQLDWLEATLQASKAPTIVALHHPPFATGIGFMDAIGLDAAAADSLEKVVGRAPHVERVVCGHAHRLMVRQWAGTTLVLAPPMASTIALDLRIGVVDGSWTREPPAFVLHEWREGSGLVTHLLHVGAFPAAPLTQSSRGRD